MKVQVHHRDHESGKLVHVADIDAPGDASAAGSYAADVAALDFAWEHSNNIDGSWSRGPHFEDGSANPDFCLFVSRLVPLPVHQGREYGLRSSMVGDVFVVEGQPYRVGSFGFDRLEEVA